MTTPVAILQSAFVRSGANSIPIALPSPPTVGNTIVVIIVGYSSSPTIPGFLLFNTINESPATSQGTYVFYRNVVAGDGTSYTISNPANYQNCMIFETTGAVGIGDNEAFNGQNPMVSKALTAAADTVNSLRLFALDIDNSVTPTTPDGWTLLSPTSWWDSGDHYAAIYQIPPDTTGQQSITMSGNGVAGVYIDIQLIPFGTTAMITSQAVTESWMQGLSSVDVTTASTEIWYVIQHTIKSYAFIN